MHATKLMRQIAEGHAQKLARAAAEVAEQNQKQYAMHQDNLQRLGLNKNKRQKTMHG